MERPKKMDHTRKKKMSDNSVSWTTDWEAYANRLNLYIEYQDTIISQQKMTIRILNKP